MFVDEHYKTLVSQLFDGTITHLTKDDFNVSKIRAFMCYEVPYLESIEFPDTVEEIGDHCFYNAYKLKKVVLPKNLKKVGISTMGNTSYKQIYIPKTLKEYCELPYSYMRFIINEYDTIYLNNEPLPKNLIIPDGTTSICDSAFKQQKITTLSIPNSVKEIKDAAFSNCSGFKDLIIPDSVVTLGTRAFFNILDIKSLVVGNGVEIIPIECFASSTYTNIDIGKNVKEIKAFAFEYCSKIQTIKMRPTTPPVISSKIFSTTSLVKIIVPKGSLEAYKTATNWSSLADYMEEATE